MSPESNVPAGGEEGPNPEEIAPTVAEPLLPPAGGIDVHAPTVALPPPGETSASDPTVIEPSPADPAMAPTVSGTPREPGLAPHGAGTASFRLAPDLDPADAAEIEAALADPQKRLGAYVVLCELGKGGMGIVLKAYDPRIGRMVAIKQVLGELGPHEWARFEREARLAGKLRHPHVAQVYEIVTEEVGLPYLVMEYVDGVPLTKLCRQRGGLPGRRAAELLLKVAEAIAYAHEQQVIHRDLKPPNVMIRHAEEEEQGEPVVLDFGLAKELGSGGLTQTGQVLGTVAYMSPEQAEGRRDVGPLSDVYGLGAILYECLTGRPPVEGKSQVAKLAALLSKDPVPPRHRNEKVHRDLETICLKCLEKRPANRYPSAEALAEELRRFLAGEPIEARPVPTAVRLARRARRHKAASLALLLALLLAAGAPLAWVRLEEERRETELHKEALDAERTLSAAEKAALREGVAALGQLSATLKFRYRPLQPDREEVLLLRNARAEVGAALARLDEALVQAPRLAELHVLRGQACLDLLDFESALASAERALELDPDYGKAWLLEARAHLLRSNLGEFQAVEGVELEELREHVAQAARSFARARTAGESFPPVVEAWSLICAGRYADAEKLLDELRETTITEEVEYARAWLAFHWHEDVPRALDLLDATLLLCPRELEALLLRSVARDRAGRLDGAIADLTLALKLRPGFPFALRCRASLAARRGDHALAEADMSALLAEQKSDAKTLCRRALTRIELHDYPGALADFTDALRLQPDDPFALEGVASCRLELRELEEAIESYSRLIELRPERANAHYGRGYARDLAGRDDAASEDYEAALKLDPDHFFARWNLAVYRVSRDDREEALAHVDHLVRLQPQNAEVWLFRGKIRRWAGEARGAALDFEQSLELAPDQSGAEDLRRYVEETLGRGTNR